MEQKVSSGGSWRLVPWREIGVFYVLAVGLSAPFRLGWVNVAELVPLPGGFSIFYGVLKAIGPVVAYFVVFQLLKSKVPQEMSLTGRFPVGSVASLVVLPVCFTVLGMDNHFGIERHWFGLLYGLMLAAYALCEEYGWRGYLQPALSPLSTPVRVLLIGCLWYLWHLNFLKAGIPIQAHLIHFGSIFLGTWGLLVVTEKTHSLLLAAAIHLIFNLFADVNWSDQNRFITLGAALVFWVWTIRGSRRSV